MDYRSESDQFMFLYVNLLFGLIIFLNLFYDSRVMLADGKIAEENKIMEDTHVDEEQQEKNKINTLKTV